MQRTDPIRLYAYALPAAFVIVALAIGATGYRYYLDQKASIENEARSRLSTIAALKVDQIANWRKERLSDAKIVAAAEPMPGLQAVLEGRAQAETAARVRLWMETVRHASDYAVVVMVNSQGKVCLTAGRAQPEGTHYAALASRVIAAGEVMLSDIHVDEGLQGPHLGLLVPLRVSSRGQPVGALLLGIDPNAFLYPLLRSWPTPSRSGETLLARREGSEVVFLNELRHRPGPALSLRMPLTNRSLPAANAVLGMEGLMEGVDYRGVKVMAATRKVPGSPWVIVSKLDIDEIHAPVREQVYWLGLIACSLVLTVGAGVSIAWRDIRLSFHRQRREAEVNRRALLEHFDYLSRFANDIILLSDVDARIVEANDRALNAYGYDRKELIGMSIRELRDASTLPAFDEDWHSLGEEGSVVFETLHRRRNGTTFPVEVSARRILIDGTPFTQSIIRDIADRIQAQEERSRLQDQLVQAQKMESIGRLAGGVAHDFNNLLTVINGYAAFAIEDLRPSDPLWVPVSEIAKAGERAASLTQQLLAFSRKQVIDPQSLDLNDVVREITKMLRRLVGEDVEVITHLAAEPVMVRADLGQLQQVLMNLAANSRDAMPTGGKLVIETENVQIGEEYVTTHAEAREGPHARLTVTDTGAGMDRETQRRAFEPFFTTKRQGEGTGLGLATVYGIVKQSGGWIWLYSEPGKGTSFRIHLPGAREAAGPEPKAPAGPARLDGSETVLVVEDQADVRQLAAEVLSRYGYSVLQAASGEEALKVCSGSREPIKLVITDVIMPGMTGRELASHLASLRPEIKVLYISGYTDNVIAHQGVLDPGVAYLSKPFSPSALARRVREILDASEPLRG